MTNDQRASKIRYDDSGSKTTFQSSIGDTMCRIIEKNFYVEIVFQTCLTCRKWNDDKQLCEKFQQKPPAHIIIRSCEWYDDKDHVPF